MIYLRRQEDFITEEIKWKFWEKDREKMELELLDAINKFKSDFKILEDGMGDGSVEVIKNLEKFKNSIDKMWRKMDSCFQYSNKNGGIMNQTLHDYLDDILETLNEMEDISEYEVLKRTNNSSMYRIGQISKLLNDLWHEIEV
jgi:hypothetical protein